MKHDYLYTQSEIESDHENFERYIRYYLDRCSSIREKLVRKGDPSDISNNTSSSFITFTPIEESIMRGMYEDWSNGRYEQYDSNNELKIGSFIIPDVVMKPSDFNRLKRLPVRKRNRNNDNKSLKS